MLLCFPTRLALPAGGEQRFFEVPPTILDGMAMVGLKAGVRVDRFDGFREAWGVIREGCGHMEAEICASLQKLPGIVPILCRRFMRYEDAVLLILDHHHTGVCAQWVVAVNMTLRRWGEGKQVPQYFLWRGQMHANAMRCSSFCSAPLALTFRR